MSFPRTLSSATIGERESRKAEEENWIPAYAGLTNQKENRGGDLESTLFETPRLQVEGSSVRDIGLNSISPRMFGLIHCIIGRFYKTFQIPLVVEFSETDAHSDVFKTGLFNGRTDSLVCTKHLRPACYRHPRRFCRPVQIGLQRKTF